MTDYEFPRHQIQFGDDPNPEASLWNNAAEHRAMITRILIDKGGERAGKLAILGAGLCNDISLKVLKEWFEEVHLFDLDGKAIWNGLDQQGLTGAEWITIHGDVDVTGLGKNIAKLKNQPSNDSDLDRIIDQAQLFRLKEFSGQFDVVASTCLLSQIFEHSISSIGEDHVRLIDLLVSLRQGHLMMLNDLCKPNGIANLIYDFVSSESLPGMIGTKGDDLANLLSDALNRNNFFHGMNPIKISEVLTQDPFVSTHIYNIKASRPWVWNATTRHYAVAAIRFQRK